MKTGAAKMNKFDARVDAYIAKKAAFARPILEHLRDVVHRACPQAVETIKWGMPFFEIDGTILCHMAAFKQHCGFGIWNKEVGDAMRAEGRESKGAMGIMGRITDLKELPKTSELEKHLKKAAKEIAAGYKPMAKTALRKPKPEAVVPDDLAKELKKNKKAAETFKNFSPSHRREYVEWITEAKREETRTARIKTTIELLVEGKSRNWKYQ